MNYITIAYITARPEPRFDWFFDSLSKQSGLSEVSQIIIVDFFAQVCDEWTSEDCIRRYQSVMNAAKQFKPIVKWVPPKPNVWAGKHRLTPRNWWHMSTARNTALIHCKNDFIAYLDDRCVLDVTWLDAVREANEKQYVVCGTFEKRINIGCIDGNIQIKGISSQDICKSGDSVGQDSRACIAQDRKMICPGSWVFGCTFALPTEWMLQVNGVDESWDSVSMEDSHFGQMLENNSFPIFHDPRMKIIEDRTGGVRGHDMKRSSKEKHPNDKNDKFHKLIDKLWHNKFSSHLWNLRAIRNSVLAGNFPPIPTSSTHDWFDSQPLKEMI